MAEKGRTTMPSMRSAHASDTMKRLVAPRSFLVILTAVITIMLPNITAAKSLFLSFLSLDYTWLFQIVIR